MPPTNRGYFGIGIYHAKTIENVGTLWRSANIMGAAFIFTIGARYKPQASDTLNTPLHVPLYQYRDFEHFNESRPHNCQLVGIEQTPDAVDLKAFKHPERAVYLLGAEDHGLPPAIIAKCQSIVSIDTSRCLNVAVAGSLVMYDRGR